ncbi:Protein NATD1 [Bagarius yarrelli]|uniref:Protein NATD1 n=1 Tax=Bagarius yarrelli TaxID=175774 RepID=A0A556TUZ3_BAGYA|nr:Protein NATD1 [Bagarius yarrelli]
MECLLLDVRLSLCSGYDCASGRIQLNRGTLTRSDPRHIMAQAPQMSVIEINSPIRVEHDKKRRQFSIRLNGSYDKAVLLYEYVGKKTVDLQHTEVPDAYRGRGIAKHLAKAAMDFVVEEDLRAHLTCWYIQKYVKENPHPHYLEHIIH